MSREFDIPFKCSCGERLTCTVSVTVLSERRTYDHPGCGCVWHAHDGVTCTCGAQYAPEWIENDAEINEEVQKRESEPCYDD